MPTGWVAPCPMLLPLKPHALIVEDLAWLAAAHPRTGRRRVRRRSAPGRFRARRGPVRRDRRTVQSTRCPSAVAALRGDGTRAARPRPSGSPACADDPDAGPGRRPEHRRVPPRRPPRVWRAVRQSPGPRRCRLGSAPRTGPPGRTTGRVLIRRVWIGEPPTRRDGRPDGRTTAATRTPPRSTTGPTTRSCRPPTTPIEAADALLAVLAASDCDSVNVRVHVKGLSPDDRRCSARSPRAVRELGSEPRPHRLTSASIRRRALEALSPLPDLPMGRGDVLRDAVRAGPDRPGGIRREAGHRSSVVKSHRKAGSYLWHAHHWPDEYHRCVSGRRTAGVPALSHPLPGRHRWSGSRSSSACLAVARRRRPLADLGALPSRPRRTSCSSKPV